MLPSIQNEPGRTMPTGTAGDGRVGVGRSRPHFADMSGDRVPNVTEEATDHPDDDHLTAVDDAQAALGEARRRLAEAPASVVVVNHVMGLYELAAIHLSATPPRLGEAALAIDAVGCLVEGLSGRLGDDGATLTDALANIRLAFVQIKNATAAAPATAQESPESPAPPETDRPASDEPDPD